MRFWFCLLWFSLLPLSVSAKDKRVALLVANETGWGKEASLKGAIEGDLIPLKKELQRLGFEVVSVENGSPNQIRQVFQHLLRKMRKPPGISTFLFYYSGHADKNYFHLRQIPGEQPFGYLEFTRLFLQLRVKRRFALLDACDSFAVIPNAARQTSRRQPKYTRKGQRNRQIRAFQEYLFNPHKFLKKGKNPYGQSDLDIQTIPMMTERPLSGLHIIASNGNAYHNNRLKTSVFTRHFLKGLKGAADTNLDGKITLDELYDYAFIQSKKESGQEMDRLVFFRGNYVMAPHYQSKLLIPKDFRGKLKIHIGAFTFEYEKHENRAVWVQLMSGQASIEITYRGRCWAQKMYIRKDRDNQLTILRKKSCKRTNPQVSAKGEETLQLRLEEADYQPPTKHPRHQLRLSSGYSDLGEPQRQVRNLHLSFGYRWAGIFGIGLEYELGKPPMTFLLHRFFLALEPGYTFRLVKGSMSLFVGGYLRGGLGWQGATKYAAASGPTALFGGGGQLALGFFVSERWEFAINGRFGVDYITWVEGSPWSLGWGIRMTGSYHF